ncbi:EAL domain-containing protein [bacterium]|nr:EAL domain-containing protein [bacterium]
MNSFEKNRFNIIIVFAISILVTWSAYLIYGQYKELKNLKNLDVQIKYYGYISNAIHGLQKERKASVLYKLNLASIGEEALLKYYTQTDALITTSGAYSNIYASKLKNAKLQEIRKRMKNHENFQVCAEYTSLIQLYLNELATIYKLDLPSEIKSEIMKYMALASMHEAMTEVDQAVTIAIMNKRFLNREHYRFFNNAFILAQIEENDFLLIASQQQAQSFRAQQESKPHQNLHEILVRLIDFTPKDTIDFDIGRWDYDFKRVNEIQENFEQKILGDIETLTVKHIDLVHNKIYLYIGLNAFVIIVILGLFLMIQRLYSGLLKQQSRLNTFAKAVENSDNNIIITDLDYKITYVNESFEKTSGYSREEVLGKNPRILQSGEHDQRYYDEIKKTIASGEKWLGEFINKKKDGSLFYEKASISPLINDKGKIEGFLALKLDVTKENEYQKQIEANNYEMEYRFYHDSLTKLANRNQFLHDLKNSTCPTVILTNINDFKQINSYYGINVGDIVLKQVASVFESIADEYGLKVYRMHSDEFALFSNTVFAHADLYDILYTIKTRISEFVFGPKELKLLLYVSIGVSECKKDSLETNDLLLEDADIALKFAKSSNHYYAFYKDAKNLVQTFEDNLIWTKKIADAIKNERIFPHFQPVVDHEGKIVFYEALMRMVDSNGNIVYPNTFLHIAKHAKLYPKITRMMSEMVFKIFEHRTEAVSLNISYEDISDERTVKHILTLMDRYKIAKRLTFEILESESIKNYEDISTFIATVKSKGCKVSIDDFGSGYSNFERILKLDIDYIKIDGSIIRSIDTDKNSKVVAETIVHFAKKSGFKLVAEFVCNESVDEIVKKLGIEYRQGFYIGKPSEMKS